MLAGSFSESSPKRCLKEYRLQHWQNTTPGTLPPKPYKRIWNNRFGHWWDKMLPLAFSPHFEDVHGPCLTVNCYELVSREATFPSEGSGQGVYLWLKSKQEIKSSISEHTCETFQGSIWWNPYLLPFSKRWFPAIYAYLLVQSSKESYVFWLSNVWSCSLTPMFFVKPCCIDFLLICCCEVKLYWEKNYGVWTIDHSFI